MSTKSIKSDTRELIRQKYKENHHPSKIAEMLNVSKRSVYRIIKDYPEKKRGTKLQFDRKTLKFQARQAVKCLCKKKEKVTCSKVLPYISETVNLRTLQTEMKEDEKLLYKKIPKCIHLTDTQKENRVAQIRKWFKDRVNFKRVIYTDECRFSLDGPDNMMSWQIPELSESFSRLKRPMGGGGVLVHGTLNLDGSISLLKWDGTICGTKYVEKLKEDIIPNIRTKNGDDFVFQHDNAPPHRCKLTRKFLNDSKIEVLEWPPLSPDLSPIENSWKILKDMVYETRSFNNKEELWLQLQKTVEIFNSVKTRTMVELREKLPDKYLDVMMKQGES